MDSFFTEHAFTAMFSLSFLASTVLPLGSEWLLVTLLLQNISPAPLVTVATLGNTLGACTTYAIGVWGGPLVIHRLLRMDASALQRAQHRYNRYGAWTLLFSWVPIIGDPLCAASGIFRTRFPVFLLLILIGKLARYAFLALITIHAAEL